ncbi:MAG: CHASE2 domain-containing protein [Candidatus Edwardsbacteria bacterium]|nr:CHASE2 domain-containing protein [Candidatus Edwardsbacteria bacterium]MBU1576137.1 CHASE2 domain-containing protein [Candidatus Edwardsbacteria bacterium]MBU2463455.1 CHASE2 domain-containing protein [Candidatus Edwardsbacteria bacterium]MBU2593177.1 CHASE2 domain-containing protein [Candidatus Edwardsbacteria bacterium]
MSNALRSKKTTGALVGIAVVAVVLAVSYLWPGLFQGMENKTYDLRYRLRVGQMGEQDIDDVVIVDIDETSLAQLGRFYNWPRLYHAKVADYLAQGGAAAVSFDILFMESDSLTPNMIQLYQDTKTEQIQEKLLLLTPKKQKILPPAEVIQTVLEAWGYDQDFGAVTGQSGIAYFPFYLSTGEPNDSSDLSTRRWVYSFPAEVTEKYKYIMSSGDLYQVATLSPPVPTLLESARGTGYYNIEPDDDGVTRRQPLFLALNDRNYASMDFQIVLDILGIKKEEVTVELGKYIRAGDKLKIPIDQNGRMLITYFGQYKKFRYISYSDVLTENVPAEYFKDKIVIIGATAAGLMDLRVVPFSNIFPGPEIHASIMETMLSGKFVQVIPWHIQLAMLIAFGLLTVFVSLRFKPVIAGLVLFALMAFYLIAANWVFERSLLWIEMVRPLAVVLFTNMAILGYRYLTEEKQKVWIKNMFQGYMSKDLVDKIMANPDLLLMGGDKKEITVFFSDIRGFSSFSEKLGTPERLIALINEYLGNMSDVVLEHGGYISKYEGDAIMAFWGAPTDDPQHAETCIKCVWAMNQRLKVLNADLAKRQMPNLFTRFGINTGQVTVGNVGSERKKSYTAMGDSVNLGSRLEGANKEYGTAIMISEFTYAKVTGLYPVRELDLLRVVGKEQPVRVYELLGLSEADVPEKKKQAVEIYLKGLAEYRAKNWDGAIALFQQALEVDPEDGPSQTYIGRCEDFKVLPPPENWDGVFVMKTK